MGKKGKGGNKKKQAKEDKEVLPEVDKEFYEIQIADLNQKLARLRSRCSELDSENEEVKKSLQKLDEDRADIIAYLKRTLQAKGDEITELQERLIALQQTREAEKTMFLEKIKVMEHDFKTMHEQLNSEIKLLNGKLNSLEEFRREREELMNKFLKQEESMEEQEKRHKIALYEVERKFIVGKDELKKDMENKLLQLSLDFQNTTDIRIATTTHRVIRENVAINNEINVLMESWKNLHGENVDLKTKERELKIEAELQRADNKVLVKKNVIQNRIIEKISSMHGRVQDAYQEMEQVRRRNESLEVKLDKALQEVQVVTGERHRLCQVLQARDKEECRHEVVLHELRERCFLLESVVNTAANCVRQALKVQEEPEEDEAYNLSQREALLSTLLALFDQPYRGNCDDPGIKESVQSLATTASNIIPTLTYATGDLGLVSKSSEWKKEARKSKMVATSSKIESKGGVRKISSKLNKQIVPESKSTVSIHPKGQKELEHELEQTLSVDSA